ncbi:hypothetical protein FGG08_002823 [Glutinoglossum americanum]|uniref:ARID domain-containing protein n=1 Tax=Glutinoglossum americanum TaxID=1670608 RepID=A0A9P8I8F0_9PEZI|nr:hypothetical protein FGG08_002823 [Glutinoglossum americanum]
MSSTPVRSRRAPDDVIIFSYCVRALIRNPESIPRQMFLSLLEKIWRQIGFEPTPFARDFLKYPPTRVVLVPVTMDDGSTKLERRVVNKGINREPLDLHRLYCEVWKLDGFRSVTDKKEWPLVAIACHFLKTERLTKASVDKTTSGERLDPDEQRIVANTKNTYERYLLQFELRMTDARRILATQGRRFFHGFQRGCHNLQGNREGETSIAVSSGSMSGYGLTGVRTKPQTHVVHAYIGLENVPGRGFDGHQKHRDAIDSCNTAKALTSSMGGELEDMSTQGIKVPQSALAPGCRVREPLESDIGSTVIRPLGPLHQYSSAAQLTSRKGKERCEPSTGTGTTQEHEEHEKPNDPLIDFDFSNFAWIDQFKKEIAAKSLTKNSKTRDHHSTIPPWYWAAEAQRANMYSTGVTQLDSRIQTPGHRNREHIVPETYWAAEGRRLGIYPAKPGHELVSARGFQDFVRGKEKDDWVQRGSPPGLCESSGNGIRRFGHRLREGLVRIKVAPTGGKPPRPLLHRIFGRKATSKGSRLCQLEMPATEYGVVGFTGAGGRVQSSHPPSSYLRLSEQGVKHEMTYRAKVERYE